MIDKELKISRLLIWSPLNPSFTAFPAFLCIPKQQFVSARAVPTALSWAAKTGWRWKSEWWKLMQQVWGRDSRAALRNCQRKTLNSHWQGWTTSKASFSEHFWFKFIYITLSYSNVLAEYLPKKDGNNKSLSYVEFGESWPSDVFDPRLKWLPSFENWFLKKKKWESIRILATTMENRWFISQKLKMKS